MIDSMTVHVDFNKSFPRGQMTAEDFINGLARNVESFANGLGGSIDQMLGGLGRQLNQTKTINLDEVQPDGRTLREHQEDSRARFERVNGLP